MLFRLDLRMQKGKPLKQKKSRVTTDFVRFTTANELNSVPHELKQQEQIDSEDEKAQQETIDRSAYLRFGDAHEEGLTILSREPSILEPSSLEKEIGSGSIAGSTGQKEAVGNISQERGVENGSLDDDAASMRPGVLSEGETVGEIVDKTKQYGKKDIFKLDK
jgi:hypothetical protein